MLQAYALGLLTSEFALKKAHEAYQLYVPIIVEHTRRLYNTFWSYLRPKKIVVRTVEETFGTSENKLD